VSQTGGDSMFAMKGKYGQKERPHLRYCTLETLAALQRLRLNIQTSSLASHMRKSACSVLTVSIASPPRKGCKQLCHCGMESFGGQGYFYLNRLDAATGASRRRHRLTAEYITGGGRKDAGRHSGLEVYRHRPSSLL